MTQALYAHMNTKTKPKKEMAPNFLSIMWYGEAFHKQGVQDVKCLILVGAFSSA
jgi:hypothetical protein